jgi:hypothetical protein
MHLMIKAKKGQKLDFEDLRILDHNSRSKDLYQLYESMRSGRSLFQSILRSHYLNLMIFYAFTAMDAVFNLAPQVALYQILQLLEQRDNGAEVAKLAVFWIFVLCAVQLVGAFVFGRMWYVYKI